LNRSIRLEAPGKQPHEMQAEFNELLGHRTLEVIAGGVLGIVVSITFYLVYYG
jgi:acid phosphatase family membrane protein YuiD